VDTRSEIERVYRERFAVYVGAVAGIVGSRDEARDVVQEAFLRALTRVGRFRGGSLEAWIWTIVLNRARDVRRRPRSGALDGSALAAEVGGSALATAVLALPERRRTVVLLRHVAGLQNIEIASVLGISPGTVAATLSQARTELSKALELEGTPR
jgi:RNA polymerase sigma-70 factor (ECF subfamily)